MVAIKQGWHVLEATKSFKHEQRQTIKVAKELCYRESVICQLKNATTSSQLNNIMREAREQSIINNR